MKLETLFLEKHPTKRTVCSFLPLMKKENRLCGNHGLYCESNWETILLRHKRDEIFVLMSNDKPVGFVTWKRYDDGVIYLQMIWIIPEYRGKKIGKMFQKLITQEFINQDAVALSLWCCSVQGATLAASSGFTPVYPYANPKHPNFRTGWTTCLTKILRNNVPKTEGSSSLLCHVYYTSDNEGEEKMFEIPLDAKYSDQPTYFVYNHSYECRIHKDGMEIFRASMDRIMRDMRAWIYDEEVVCLNHDIEVPAHWLSQL